MTALVVAVIDDPEHEIAYDDYEVEVVVLNGWLINDAPPFDESFIKDMQFHMDVCAELLGGEWIEWVNGAPDGEERRWAEDHSDKEPDTRRLLTTSQKFLLFDYYLQVERNKRITEEHHS